MTPHDPQAGSRIRGAIALPIALLLAIIYVSITAIFALIMPKKLRAHSPAVIQNWARMVLWILKIRVEVHGKEHLDSDQARIVLFNHVNAFDLIILARFWSLQSSVIYKKEFHRIPLLGFIMRTVGMIAVDRSNRERALASMSEAAERIRSEEKHVYVAPEGTRSKTGKLGKFKKGPFHLALQTKAPLVPIIMRGHETLVPGSFKPSASGVIRVDFLEPTETDQWTHRDLDHEIAVMRARFLELLPDGTA